jgi:3'(2'), 5'-bisphosphate nucleotidase/myo-inositol-1(or 4)-monophosphatase
MQARLAAAMRKVGARILDCRNKGITDGNWEGTQFKAAADLIADECLRMELRSLSDVPIVSEEDLQSQSANRPSEYWLVDPIDGTASFAGGFDGFVTQAAFIKDGQPCLAAVYAPALDRLYLAERGRGASANGRPIHVKPADAKKLTLVDNYPEPRGIAKRLFEELDCARYLESGSIGLKICLVAAGDADIFVKNVVLRDWDVAGPHLVLHEAGGSFAQFEGGRFEYAGGYEKLGLIATSTASLLERVLTVLSAKETSL